MVVWLCWVYDMIANLAPVRERLALANGAGILRIETTLHLDPEAALDHWLAAHHSLALAVSNYYDNAHFVVTIGLLAWIWWRAPGVYRPLRNSLILINVIGMLGYWIFPTAPPRLLDPAMYPDVVASTHAFGSWHSGTLAGVANQFAAMPSLHMAWATWCALATWRLFSGRRLRGLVWIYPAVTAVAVMSTGNHYLLDVLAGLATFALSTFVADRWQGWWTARQARQALVHADPDNAGAAGSTTAAAP
jgi:membrane-associated phospholipid phosphatase